MKMQEMITLEEYSIKKSKAKKFFEDLKSETCLNRQEIYARIMSVGGNYGEL